VSGNGNWQEESLYLFSGDQIFVTITGQWCAWPSGCDFPDRLGVEYGGILNVPLGGLIGKIGNGSPFYLKTATTIQVNETGELYLRINDPDVSDNSGTISVRIEIK